MASITPAAIRAATDQLGDQEACWAERYQAAAKLLINGGWLRRGQFVTFPPNVVAMTGYAGCSCQEGSGPIVCLHKVALAILALAEDMPEPVGVWPEIGWTTIAQTASVTLRRCRVPSC